MACFINWKMFWIKNDLRFRKWQPSIKESFCAVHYLIPFFYLFLRVSQIHHTSQSQATYRTKQREQYTGLYIEDVNRQRNQHTLWNLAPFVYVESTKIFLMAEVKWKAIGVRWSNEMANNASTPQMWIAICQNFFHMTLSACILCTACCTCFSVGGE